MGFTLRLDGLAMHLGGPARFLAGIKAGVRSRATTPDVREPDLSAPDPAAPAPAPRAGMAALVALRSRFARGKAVAISSAVPAETELPKVTHATPSCIRLGVPLRRVAPEAEVWAQVVAVHAGMAAAGQWADLLAALRAADQSRFAVGGGKRVFELVSQGARAALTTALEARDFGAAQAELVRFERVVANHPDDYAAAHLLAQSHLDLGWALRGALEAGAASDRATAAGQPGGPQCQAWQAYRQHVALAEAVLDPFDPLECYSPLLAGTRYLLVRGLDDGEALCRDWYEDWSDLDPTNWTCHATHAPHLLPDWFGNLRDFDPEARAAAARTKADMGAAAYAMYHMAAADVLGDLPPVADLPLLLQGLRDFAADTGCQYRANIVAGVLTELAHALHLEGPEDAPDLVLVSRTLDDVMTGRLREFHLPAWENGESCIRWALEHVFGDGLTAQTNILAGDAGLCLSLRQG